MIWISGIFSLDVHHYSRQYSGNVPASESLISGLESIQCDVWGASQVLTVLCARPGQRALINLVLIIQYTHSLSLSLLWAAISRETRVWVSHHLVCVFIITSLSPIIKLINMSQPIISITNNINLATENLSRPLDDHARPRLAWPEIQTAGSQFCLNDFSVRPVTTTSPHRSTL